MSRLAVLLLLALALAASSYSELWNRHVVWTREYAKAAIAHDEAGAATALARLMQNQDDIGAALGQQIHDTVQGTQVATLLKEHIALAGALLAVMIQGNDTIEPAVLKWQHNADAIADKFAALGQPRQLWSEMLHKHLKMTQKEFELLIVHDNADDVGNYDAILGQAQEMADAMIKMTVPIDQVRVVTPVAVTASPVVGYPPAGATEVVYPGGYRVLYYNGYEDGWWIGIWLLIVFVFFFVLMLFCVPCDDPYYSTCKRTKA